ncbi:GNAT family N-acetyltransferase [Iodobacter fluviatilis]|uniref:Acetyltransferase (GNAT) family protein n=1 Tax=Iodobacter fluviatilis TaxID=537 RepID=A0A377Q783_9NEIS|nr:GNAT family N-acetyltransferase [Iodobacter fluviatilis]TCU88804.1 acetyltransferase (GNAT) family protein [Iodobacter fluviatilis]STQ91124.1 ribosomal-protein-alanine acetyltransferase [Iodobacter fluviatilis]
MNTLIKKTEEVDWKALKELRLESLKESPTAFGLSYSSMAESTDAQWQDRAACRTPPSYFIAWNDSEAIGMIGGVINNDEYNLIAMWVSPNNRSLGIAKKLVEVVLGHAKEMGKSSVVLSVSPENAPAKILYESMGFCFIKKFEYLDSHPHIQVQKMVVDLSIP